MQNFKSIFQFLLMISAASKLTKVVVLVEMDLIVDESGYQAAVVHPLRTPTGKCHNLRDIMC